MQRPVGSSAKPSADPEEDAASKTADQLLRGSEKKSEYDLSTAKKIERKKRLTTSRNPKQRILKLGAIILCAFLVVATIEVIILFQQDEVVIVPEKGFE